MFARSLSSAAHELVEAAEKESRQSRAAALERQRELEWIEEHEDGKDLRREEGREEFQR